MADQRQVDYVLNVKPNPAAGRTVDELIGKASRLKNELNAAGKASQTVGGTGAGGYVAPGTGGHRPGGPNAFNLYGASMARILPGLGIGAAALMLGQHWSQQGAQALKVQSDPYASDYQKDRALKESLPIMGGFVKSWLEFVDELADWGPRFREIQRRMQRALQEIEIQSRHQQESFRLRSGLEGAESHLVAARRAHIASTQEPMLGLTDPRFAGIQQGISGKILAERGLYEALARQNTAGGELASASAESSFWTKAAAIKGRELRGANPRTEEEQLAVDKKRAEYAELNAKAQAEIARYQRAQKEYSSAAADVERARNQLSEAGINLARERMQLLQTEKETTKAGIIQFGMMRPEEQGAAVRAAQRMKEFGPQVLSDRERGLVGRAGLFDKLTENEALKSGMASPFLAQALKVAGMRGLNDIQKDIQNVKLDMDIRFLDVHKAAEEFALKVIPALKEAMGLERIQRELERAAKENEQFQRKALSPTGGK